MEAVKKLSWLSYLRPVMSYLLCSPFDAEFLEDGQGLIVIYIKQSKPML